MKRCLCFLFLFAIALVFITNSFQSVSAQTYALVPQTSAKGMILVEKTTGRVLAEKNADEQLSIASTTKIVTALTVLENCSDIKKVVTIDKKCVGIEGTSIYLREGEKLSVEDLLYGLMLRSGNDAAVALAYAVGGSVDKFCQMMNDTAKKCGATGCNFTNPHGLEQEGHHCSARDLANITRFAMQNQEFAKIVGAKQYRISASDDTTGRVLQNKNKMLSLFDGANGVKTGFTKKAGRCLVSSGTRDGMTLICVVLCCGPMWEESAALLEYGFKNYKMKELLQPYFVCGNIEVQNSDDKFVEVFSMKGFSYPMTEEEYQKVRVEFDYPSIIQAPVPKEKIVGKVVIKLDNDLLFEENIYTIKEVESKFVRSGLKDLINKWFG
ncbi:MAG: D-alanyl-D-alanine carboxypeptidase family protein [Christensenellales bacterium]